MKLLVGRWITFEFLNRSETNLTYRLIIQRCEFDFLSCSKLLPFIKHCKIYAIRNRVRDRIPFIEKFYKHYFWLICKYQRPWLLRLWVRFLPRTSLGNLSVIRIATTKHSSRLLQHSRCLDLNLKLFVLCYNITFLPPYLRFNIIILNLK